MEESFERKRHLSKSPSSQPGAPAAAKSASPNKLPLGEAEEEPGLLVADQKREQPDAGEPQGEPDDNYDSQNHELEGHAPNQQSSFVASSPAAAPGAGIPKTKKQLSVTAPIQVGEPQGEIVEGERSPNENSNLPSQLSGQIIAPGGPRIPNALFTASVASAQDSPRNSVDAARISHTPVAASAAPPRVSVQNSGAGDQKAAAAKAPKFKSGNGNNNKRGKQKTFVWAPKKPANPPRQDAGDQHRPLPGARPNS